MDFPLKHSGHYTDGCMPITSQVLTTSISPKPYSTVWRLSTRFSRSTPQGLPCWSKQHGCGVFCLNQGSSAMFKPNHLQKPAGNAWGRLRGTSHKIGGGTRYRSSTRVHRLGDPDTLEEHQGIGARQLAPGIGWIFANTSREPPDTPFS